MGKRGGKKKKKKGRRQQVRRGTEEEKKAKNSPTEIILESGGRKAIKCSRQISNSKSSKLPLLSSFRFCHLLLLFRGVLQPEEGGKIAQKNCAPHVPNKVMQRLRRKKNEFSYITKFVLRTASTRTAERSCRAFCFSTLLDPPGPFEILITQEIGATAACGWTDEQKGGKGRSGSGASRHTQRKEKGGGRRRRNTSHSIL